MNALFIFVLKLIAITLEFEQQNFLEQLLKLEEIHQRDSHLYHGDRCNLSKYALKLFISQIQDDSVNYIFLQYSASPHISPYLLFYLFGSDFRLLSSIHLNHTIIFTILSITKPTMFYNYIRINMILCKYISNDILSKFKFRNFYLSDSYWFGYIKL